MNNLRIIASIAALFLLLPGCLSPEDNAKGVKGDGIKLKEYHLEVSCNFAVSGNSGLKVEFKDCGSGDLVKGTIKDCDVDWTGATGNLGTIRSNRNSSVSTVCYYPQGSGNSNPIDQKINVENSKSVKPKADVKIPLNKEGKYSICFHFIEQSERHPYRPGYQYANRDKTICPEFRVSDGKVF